MERQTNHARKLGFDCKARIKFALVEDSGVYEITMHNGDHSHELIAPNNAYMLRSHRNIRPAQRGLINSMADSGIGSADIYHYFGNEAGGYDKLNFSQADCDSVVQKRRRDFLKIGDGALLLDYLQKKQKENPSFFYKLQLDEKNQIRNCFWCDAKMRIDYQQFGDVVCFDTTYKTNNYDMPFAPIVGVNHHRQTVIFASVLLSDEKTETFIWVFEMFLEAMGGKRMQTIFTDQAMAICNAVKQVFPDTHHRLCVWHIYQNALRNLSHVFTKYKTFNDDFMKCIYDAEVEEEFLAHWSSLLEKYDLKEEKWLKGIFLLREKWAQVYGREHFCAGMVSTQRSESINNYFKKYFKRKQILCEFMMQYDKAISLRRQKEVSADTQSSSSRPDMVSSWVVECDAVKIYTRKMFNRLQGELKAIMDFDAIELPNFDSSSMVTYDVVSYNGGRVHKVEFAPVDNTVKCSCKRFEFNGVPCTHMLKVLRMKNVTVLPAQYFLKRWSKDVNNNPNVIIDTRGNTLEVDTNVPMSERYSDLSNVSQTLITIASINSTRTEVAKSALKRAIDEVQACEETEQDDVLQEPVESNVTDRDAMVEENGVNQINSNITIWAPPLKKLSGEPVGRRKGFYDTMKKNGKGNTRKRNATDDGNGVLDVIEQNDTTTTTKRQPRKRATDVNGNGVLDVIENVATATKRQPKKRAKGKESNTNIVENLPEVACTEPPNSVVPQISSSSTTQLQTALMMLIAQNASGTSLQSQGLDRSHVLVGGGESTLNSRFLAAPSNQVAPFSTYTNPHVQSQDFNCMQQAMQQQAKQNGSGTLLQSQGLDRRHVLVGRGESTLNSRFLAAPSNQVAPFSTYSNPHVQSQDFTRMQQQAEHLVYQQGGHLAQQQAEHLVQPSLADVSGYITRQLDFSDLPPF